MASASEEFLRQSFARRILNKLASVALLVICQTLLLFSFSSNVYAQEFSLRGSVRDDQKKPLSAVTVRVSQPEHQIQMQVLTDREGNFSFRNLASGKYRVETQLANFENSIKEVTLEKSSTQLDFVLKPLPSAVRGRPSNASAKAGA